MRKPLLKARQLLLLAYLLAAVLWVVRCLVGCGVMLNYKLQGKMPQTHVDAAELVTESFAPYSSNEWWTPPDDDQAWYLSTDSDPHIYWQGQGYIETVVLDAAHRLPPGGVALYYLKPGQTDYTEAQKVYAKVTAPGVYTFDLGGQWVTGLRIDPDSVGGVPTLFTGIDLIYKKGTEDSIGTVTTEAKSIEAGQRADIEATLPANKPALWSTENPNLYTVKTEVKVGDTVVDTYETEYGFRYTEQNGSTGFKLNGEPMKLKGVCMHHDQGSLGAEANRRAIERQVEILQEMGCNSIRVTHNPAADELIIQTCTGKFDKKVGEKER